MSMRQLNHTQRLWVIALLSGLLIVLCLFIIVSAIVHHLVLAAILVFLGIIATGAAWFLRRLPFLLLGSGGIGMSIIGSILLGYSGLYAEAIAAIVVIFIGGIVLAILIMGRQLLRTKKLSPVEQEREFRLFVQSFLDKVP